MNKLSRWINGRRIDGTGSRSRMQWTRAFTIAMLAILVFAINLNTTPHRTEAFWPVGSDGSDSGHGAITESGLFFLNPERISQVAESNTAVDEISEQIWSWFFDDDRTIALRSEFHFDNCQFDTSVLSINRRYEALENIDSGDLGVDKTFAQFFGSILHTAQDLYSHSNLVELRAAGLVPESFTLLDRNIGKWEPLGVIDESSGLRMITDWRLDKPILIATKSHENAFEKSEYDLTLWDERSIGSTAVGSIVDTIIRAVGFDNNTYFNGTAFATSKATGESYPLLITGSHDANTDTSQCITAINIPHGEFHGVGEGLNKDAFFRVGHAAAKALAIQQTTHEWCRLLFLVKPDVRQHLLDTWVEDRDAMDEACRVQELPESPEIEPRSFGLLPTDMTTADFNHDGAPDLATANNVRDSVSILLGKGDGTFPNKTDYPIRQSAVKIATGDFNEDGNPDLVMTDEGVLVTLDPDSNDPSPFPKRVERSDLSILFGRGDGSFWPDSLLDGAIAGREDESWVWRAIDVGDVDSDGHLDILLTSRWSSEIVVRYGNGRGGFPEVAVYDAGMRPRDLALSDFNGDSFVDLVVTTNQWVGSIPDEQPSSVSILMGMGNRSFQSPVFPPITERWLEADGYSDALVADIDGDGLGDLVLLDSGGQFTVSLSFGDGTFSPGSVFLGVLGISSITSLDINGDGLLDLVVSTWVNDIYVMYGDYFEGFLEAEFLTTGDTTFKIIGEDFNLDGRPDIATVNRDSNNIVLHLNFFGGFSDENSINVPVRGISAE